MRTANADEVQWQRFSSHRPGMARNKRLLAGNEGDLRNYELSIVECQDGYRTPEHHHIVDQVRFMLEGRFGVGEGLVLEEGSLSYFPEGVLYTQEGIGTSRTLLLQFGGHSGSGFMSYRQLERGHYELSQNGEFSKGCYQREGEAETHDAYEAIWEHINERKIEYPSPRYQMPIIARPDNFAWQPIDGETGVAIAVCGRFSSTGIGMGLIKVERSASHRLVATRLYYLTSGSGRCGGASWPSHTAADPEGEDHHLFVADEESVFLYYDRPVFEG